MCRNLVFKLNSPNYRLAKVLLGSYNEYKHSQGHNRVPVIISIHYVIVVFINKRLDLMQN
jgi:hypothetical protein